jgi:hypothetical protein
MPLGGAALAALARRVGAPYPALVALAGAGLALVPGLPTLVLDHELALALFVAPVLIDPAFEASPRDLRANWRPVASLALGAVALTIAVEAVASCPGAETVNLVRHRYELELCRAEEDAAGDGTGAGGTVPHRRPGRGRGGRPRRVRRPAAAGGVARGRHDRRHRVPARRGGARLGRTRVGAAPPAGAAGARQGVAPRRAQRDIGEDSECASAYWVRG